MARLRTQASPTGHRVAVVDDDTQLRNSLTRLLSADGHEVRTATDAVEGVTLVRSWRPHLVLLDYYMPNGTGADVVKEIRTFAPIVQVILVTAYAAEQPARQLMRQLDIQGYHDKGDGPERLLVFCDAALKHYQALESLDRQRSQLRHILDVAPEISRLQPIAGVFYAALKNVVGLLDGAHGVLATSNHGLFVMDEARERVAIRAAMGRYEGAGRWQDLPGDVVAAIRDGLSQDEPHELEGRVVIPLRTRNDERGCIIVDEAQLSEGAVEPCKLYARHVVHALENVMLYEEATVDSLTKLQRRAAGLERLESILRLAARLDAPTSLLMIDVDHFKRINDTYGHVAGDLVLRAVASTILGTCRVSDVAVRYGGEEILVVLPATPEAGALVAAERIRTAIEKTKVSFESNSLRVTASIGVTTASVGDFDVQALVHTADQGLYEAKHSGRNCVRVAARPPIGAKASTGAR